jgi:hypothetical protein
MNLGARETSPKTDMQLEGLEPSTFGSMARRKLHTYKQL